MAAFDSGRHTDSVGGCQHVVSDFPVAPDFCPGSDESVCGPVADDTDDGSPAGDRHLAGMDRIRRTGRSPLQPVKTIVFRPVGQTKTKIAKTETAKKTEIWQVGDGHFLGRHGVPPSVTVYPQLPLV